MKIKKYYVTILVLLFVSAILLNACKVIRNFTDPPKPWAIECKINSKLPDFDAKKSNVFIVADSKMTELFDMLAPFYLFNTSGKANVYIVAKDKTPILIKRNLFIVPQLTFKEVDSLKLKADVIVIPALSKRDENQDTLVIDWIKKHFGTDTKMLAICDGASTAAATGLYNGKPITCHASDLDGLKSHFDKPLWIRNVTVAKSGNLFSTAGVSNAVEGSLTVIGELFGPETMHKVLMDIHYPNPQVKSSHESIVLKGRNKFTAALKVLFRSNKNIGVLLQNGVNEFEMAGILDTYGRTLPASFKTYMLNDSTVRTKYGLSLIYTGDNSIKGLDELHIIMPESFSTSDESYFKKIKTIRYDGQQSQYLIDVCLKQIADQYGDRFADFVKISLDYN
jgi:transcriptional regulator GlxA family with amidase domain